MEASVIKLTDIHSLTDFQRNAKRHLIRMKKSGHPQILTVNGKAAVVVQDALSYQKLLDRLDMLEAIQGIRHGIQSMERGEGRSVDAFDRDMRKRRNIPRE
jgi:hypothetical protein